MTEPLKTFKRFDVVVVAFPFTDKKNSKNRPAVVISSSKSFNDKIDHSILAMITSSEHSDWPLDTELIQLEKAGLTKASKVRFKLFTLDHVLMKSKIGHLGTEDIKNLRKNLAKLFRL